MVQPTPILRPTSLRYVHIGIDLDMGNTPVSQVEGQADQGTHQTQVANRDCHLIFVGSEVEVAGAQTGDMLQHIVNYLLRRLCFDR